MCFDLANDYLLSSTCTYLAPNSSWHKYLSICQTCEKKYEKVTLT